VQIAKWLVDCRPADDKDCYLHLISIVPKEDEPPTDRKYAVIYEEMKKKDSFGILSSKTLPKVPPFSFLAVSVRDFVTSLMIFLIQVCSFPAFVPFGELQVSVISNYKRLKLKPDQVDDLASFNERLFDKMTLCVDSSYSAEGGGKDYFVVPTKTGKKLETFVRFKVVPAR